MTNDSNDYKTYYASEIGLIEIVGTAEVIKTLYFVEPEMQQASVESKDLPPLLLDCVAQIDDYFKGKRQAFSLPLKMEGTDFQKQVWQQLLSVPFGETVSYLDIAKGLHNEKAVRAVGAANGQNPISIIVPCHRIIGSNGKLTGYGGGLWRKEWLLNHEWVVVGKQLALF